jgi:hypothetical protein
MGPTHPVTNEYDATWKLGCGAQKLKDKCVQDGGKERRKRGEGRCRG